MIKSKITHKLLAIIGAFAMAISVFPSAAFAAEPENTVKVQEDGKVMVDSGIVPLSSVGSYWAGDHDLGGFTFTDKNRGASRTFHTQYMQIKPAWKAADSATSEVDLYVKVVRAWNGDVAYENRFTLKDDVDGKDSSGWWYVESPWFKINKDSDYYIYYEAFTTPGYAPTGSSRRASVHTWIELGN